MTSILDRRTVMQSAAASLLTSALAPASLARNAVTAKPSLGAMAAAKGILFGASLATHELDKPTGASYAEMYRSDARIITSELEFKLSALRPSPDTIAYAGADRFLAFAERHAMAARAHTLLWNDDVPAWVSNLSNSAVARLLEEHITAVMSRYRGRVRTWDVVNEPIAPWESDRAKLRSGPFLRALGRDYMSRGLRLARAIDPSARLVVNEQGTERADARGEIFRAKFAELIEDLLAQGVPLDAVGVQCHMMPGNTLQPDAYARYLERFSRAGLEIHVTEFDVDDTGLSDDIRQRDAEVAAIYRDFLSAILANPRVTELVTWQIGDSHSGAHYAAQAKGTGAMMRMPRPLLYDDAYTRKPSWFAVRDVLLETPHRLQPTRHISSHAVDAKGDRR
jgi:endo-1,4-beta-xylanase